MGGDFLDYSKTMPRFNSALGYLILLDDLIRFACGYYIGGDMDKYGRTLLSWYVCTIERFERLTKSSDKKNKHSDLITADNVKKLTELKDSIIESDVFDVAELFKFHEKLDQLTSAAGLRMQDTSKVPDIMQM